MDVLEVKKIVRRAVDRARKGDGPSLVECKTYRFYGHSRGDPRVYRTREEEKKWKKRDPILTLKKKLVKSGILTSEMIKQLEEKVFEKIREAEEFALSSAFPSIDSLYDDVYAPKYVDQQSSIKNFSEAQNLNLRMKKITYRQAINEALREEMLRDENVFLIGEDIGLYGGAYGVTNKLFNEFGSDRVRDTPISEAGIAGAAAGAAMTGMRPVAEIMYIDFSTIATDQIINIAAKNRYMFGGKSSVPVVYRTQGGTGEQRAAHHSQSLEAWYVHVPGIFVVMPSTPFDVKGLLKTCVRENNPVMFIEHKVLYNTEGLVPEIEYTIPLGLADVKKEGNDVTIVAYSRMVSIALKAAQEMAKDGINCEIIDLRSLKPLDMETVVSSVKKTNRAIIVSEGYRNCGVSAEVATQIMEKAFDYLDAPIIRLAGEDVPPPMSPILEEFCIPNKDRIINAVKKII
jgi:2-oxoisovalerate dehydrogenase E1 component